MLSGGADVVTPIGLEKSFFLRCMLIMYVVAFF